MEMAVTRRLRPFRPSWLIDLVIFVEHPHCYPGSLRGEQKRPLVDDERGLGRGADSEGIIKETGTSLEPVCREPVGLPVPIRQQFQFVLACYSDTWCFPCFLVCIELFQADDCR